MKASKNSPWQQLPIVGLVFPWILLLTSLVSHGLADTRKPWARHTIDASSQGADGVRLMDVNGDGHLDVATAWEEGGVVRAYLNPGKATLKDNWPAVTVGNVKSGEDAVFVDLDVDGAVDIVSACEGNTRALHVHWAPKDPERYLDPSAWITEAIPSAKDRMQWMYALPMNVDGQHGIDLVVAGKGKDGEIGWLAAPENPRDLTAWRYQSIHSMSWVMSMRLEDMDGDGDQDVLYDDRKQPSRGIYWLEREGGQWRRHRLGDSDWENMFLSTGDLDSDSRQDVICAVRNGPIMWYRGVENGWVRHEIPLPHGVGTGKSAVIADIDGNGHNDVVFSCENAKGDLSGVRWLSWENDPVTGPWQSHEISGPLGVKFDRLALEDLDRDGDLDILTCEERDQLGVVWYENPEGVPQRPNILLIMADDLGYECLGSYGGTSYQTPNLDKLAAGGRRFTNCFSTPKCSPSRVTLLTGRYTPRTTMTWGHIPPDEITFGHVMKRAGYATALAGKWQLGRIADQTNIVPQFGFDDYAVWGWHEGPRYWKPLVWQNGRVLDNVKDRFGPDVYTEFLIDFMKEDRDRPFLAYYPMTLTHFPKKDEPKGPNGQWETFGEMVSHMDRLVGKLVSALDKSGLREDTLILFTADNGTPNSVTSLLGDRAIRGGKAKLTDAGTRVPFIANQPGTVAVGMDTELVDFTDILPTLAELGRTVKPERVLDGRSFLKRLHGDGRPTRGFVFTEWGKQRWVRDKHLKLYDDGRLCDVSQPFGEERILTQEATQARLRLQGILDRFPKSSPHP